MSGKFWHKIRLQKPLEFRIFLYDDAGKEINAEKFTVDINSCEQDVYIVKVKTQRVYLNPPKTFEEIKAKFGTIKKEQPE
jgi:hypothetical protein